MDYLDFDVFDVQEYIDENGKPSIKYLIKDKVVTKDTWKALKQDSKEKLQKLLNKTKQVEQDTCDTNQCNCDRCNFIWQVIEDLNKCNDEEKFQMLRDIFDSIDEEGFTVGLKTGVETGSKEILKHFVEQMNQIIYSPMDVDFDDCCDDYIDEVD